MCRYKHHETVTHNQMYFEGNNGGDYLKIEVLEDGRLLVQCGHCCVPMFDATVPVEFLTTLISEAVLKHPNPKDMMEAMWPTEHGKKLAEMIDDGLNVEWRDG